VVTDERDSLTPASLLRCTLAAGAVAIFYTSVDMYALLAWAAPAPVLWVIGVVAGAALLVLVQPHRGVSALRSPLTAWAAFFFLGTTAWAMWMDQSARAAQVVIDRYRSISLLVALAVIFDGRRARRVGTYAVAAAVVFASVINVAELAGAIEFVSTPNLFRVGGRAAGFYVNPNDAGMAIVFGLAVSVIALPVRWRLPLLLVGAIGVGATFSRGAALCLATLLAAFAWRKEISGRALAVVAAILLLATLRTGFVSSLDAHGILNENTSARLRLETDDSGRGELALKALGLFLEHPLAGAGLATTRTWDAGLSSHDTYLNLAADQGVIGLLTLPLFVLALAASNRRSMPLGAVLLVAGVFSDGLLDQQRFTLLVAALASVGTPEVEPITERVLVTEPSTGVSG
jgi:hypothetical protein